MSIFLDREAIDDGSKVGESVSYVDSASEDAESESENEPPQVQKKKKVSSSAICKKFRASQIAIERSRQQGGTSNKENLPITNNKENLPITNEESAYQLLMDEVKRSNKLLLCLVKRVKNTENRMKEVEDQLKKNSDTPTSNSNSPGSTSKGRRNRNVPDEVRVSSRQLLNWGVSYWTPPPPPPRGGRNQTLDFRQVMKCM